MNINDLIDNVQTKTGNDTRNHSFGSYLIAAAILEVVKSNEELIRIVALLEDTVAKGMGRR